VVMYLGVGGFIEVPVPSQESEWSCIYVLDVTGTSIKPLTHKYITTHFPGLVRALQ
jgi:hypothetical protein